MDVMVLEELATKVDWLVGPSLPDDLGHFFHAQGSCFLGNTRSFVLDRLAPFSDSELKPPVRYHIHHGVRFRHLKRAMQGQHADGNAETDSLCGAGYGGQEGWWLGNGPAITAEVMFGDPEVIKSKPL